MISCQNSWSVSCAGRSPVGARTGRGAAIAAPSAASSRTPHDHPAWPHRDPYLAYLRTCVDVVVGADLPSLEVADERPDRIERAGAAVRPQVTGPRYPNRLETERMNVLDVVERQRGDVTREVVEEVVLEEILLDVRDVERGDRRAPLADVAADGAQRLRAGEVADDRDDEVALLQALQELEVVLGREIAVRSRRPSRSAASDLRRSGSCRHSRGRRGRSATSNTAAPGPPRRTPSRSFSSCSRSSVDSAKPCFLIRWCSTACDVLPVELLARFGTARERREQLVAVDPRTEMPAAAASRTAATGTRRGPPTARRSPCTSGAAAGCRAGCRR